MMGDKVVLKCQTHAHHGTVFYEIYKPDLLFKAGFEQLVPSATKKKWLPVGMRCTTCKTADICGCMMKLFWVRRCNNV
jgi:hypothetical protein